MRRDGNWTAVIFGDRESRGNCFESRIPRIWERISADWVREFHSTTFYEYRRPFAPCFSLRLFVKSISNCGHPLCYFVSLCLCVKLGFTQTRKDTKEHKGLPFKKNGIKSTIVWKRLHLSKISITALERF